MRAGEQNLLAIGHNRNMSLHRRNPRRDANEPEIISALLQMGFAVDRISGAGIPDLLLSRSGRWYVAEVKTAKGRLKPAQERFREQAQGPVPVLKSAQEAVEWANGIIQAAAAPWNAKT